MEWKVASADRFINRFDARIYLYIENRKERKREIPSIRLGSSFSSFTFVSRIFFSPPPLFLSTCTQTQTRSSLVAVVVDDGYALTSGLMGVERRPTHSVVLRSD